MWLQFGQVHRAAHDFLSKPLTGRQGTVGMIIKAVRSIPGSRRGISA
jgi:hypothetical protein